MLHFDSNWVSVTLQFIHLLSSLTIWAQQKGQIIRMSPLTCALTANYNGHFTTPMATVITFRRIV